MGLVHVANGVQVPRCRASIAGAIIAEAITSCGWHAEGKIPEEAIIRGRARQNICIVATVWYDNIIVHCAQEQVFRVFFTNFRAITRHLNVTIKDPGITASKMTVQYLGIVAVNEGRCRSHAPRMWTNGYT